MSSTGSAATRARATLTNGRLLLLGLLALGAVLIASGRITRDELLAFAILIPSIVLHEWAHGASASLLGDDTAKLAGRLSLNPAAHVDPVGTLLLPALTILGGIGFVGWAKPVPVSTAKLRNSRNGALLVALAGPLMNLALVAVAWLGFRLSFDASSLSLGFLPRLFFYLGLTNIWLACFNLIPVPPLDGSALLERLLPASAWPRYLRIRPLLFPIVIAAVLLDAVLHLGILSRLYDQIFRFWASLLGLSA